MQLLFLLLAVEYQNKSTYATVLSLPEDNVDSTRQVISSQERVLRTLATIYSPEKKWETSHDYLTEEEKHSILLSSIYPRTYDPALYLLVDITGLSLTDIIFELCYQSNRRLQQHLMRSHEL